MKLNRLTDYAVLILWRLSQPAKSGELTDNKGNRIMSAPSLSEETIVPLPTVSKIVKMLAKQGLVNSVRGSNGGSSLAKDSASITVAQIIEAIEGPLSLTACVEEGGEVCEHTKLCGMSGNWDKVNDQVLAVLNSIPLDDMVPKPLSFLDPETFTPKE